MEASTAVRGTAMCRRLQRCVAKRRDAAIVNAAAIHCHCCPCTRCRLPHRSPAPPRPLSRQRPQKGTLPRRSLSALSSRADAGVLAAALSLVSAAGGASGPSVAAVKGSGTHCSYIRQRRTDRWAGHRWQGRTAAVAVVDCRRPSDGAPPHTSAKPSPQHSQR